MTWSPFWKATKLAPFNILAQSSEVNSNLEAISSSSSSSYPLKSVTGSDGRGVALLDAAAEAEAALADDAAATS
jgi:hypothetical protein